MIDGFFDIRDERAFFTVVSNTLDLFRSTKAKRPEHLLLLVLGLAHLREWIAPEYKQGSTPSNRAEHFAAMLFKNTDYQAILFLANHAKHQRRKNLAATLTTTHVDMIGERDTPISSWLSIVDGPASAYQYGDLDLEELFTIVTSLYREQWFNLPIQHDKSP